jgi:diguanylate cyclase (GGDEF)-like protein
MSDCSSKILIERAEQIREGVKQLRLEREQRPLGDITLSIGVALFPDHGRSLEALFQAADAALYQAKRAGRDQVAVADPLRSITVPDRSHEKESEQ